MSSKPAPWSFRLLAAILGLGLALGGAELGVRLLDPPGSRPPPESHGPWTPGMGPSRSRVTRFVEKGVTHEVPFVTNSLGFRDGEPVRLKPPGATRVAVLGDSFVAGLAVPADKLLHEVLETRLKAHSPNAEALAFGVVGYGTGLEKITLDEVVLDLSPDIVVLTFFQNDPWDNHPGLGSQQVPYFHLEAGLLVRKDPPVEAKKKPGKGEWLKRTSRLYLWQKRLVRQLTDAWKYRQRSGVEALPKVYRPLVEPRIPGLDEAWELTRALVDSMHEACRARGIQLVVMDIPLQESVSPSRFALSTERFPGLTEVTMDWDRSVLELGQHCRGQEIAYFDLREVFRGLDPAAYFFEEDGHFTVEGHAKVGEALAGFLVREGLVSRQ